MNRSAPLLPVQGKIVAQGRLLLQDTFMVCDQDSGLLSRMKERRVFLFEQIVIFSEPLDKKKGYSTPGYLFKNSIKVIAVGYGSDIVLHTVSLHTVTTLWSAGQTNNQTNLRSRRCQH